ncbi:MAG TPA: hypothetical protein VJT73_20640 [Polyangiaceae bacterium]|nr:hypothetical protein [Polyangiaceae bacterium]
MPRYLVEWDAAREDEREPQGPLDGLAVAKALAATRSNQGRRNTVVLNADTRKELARFEPSGGKTQPPSLVRSVQRMRAANDRLKEALVPNTSARKKGA